LLGGYGTGPADRGLCGWLPDGVELDPVREGVVVDGPGVGGSPAEGFEVCQRLVSDRDRPVSRWPGYMVHRAWVGDMRAARRAGHSPARAPMSTATPSPPAHASAGMTTIQPLACA
jgi:hypothetical protein